MGGELLEQGAVHRRITAKSMREDYQTVLRLGRIIGASARACAEDDRWGGPVDRRESSKCDPDR